MFYSGTSTYVFLISPLLLTLYSTYVWISHVKTKVILNIYYFVYSVFPPHSTLVQWELRGAGEIAQWLKTIAALRGPEFSSWQPHTALRTSCNCSCTASDAFGTHGHLHIHDIHKHVCMQAHFHTPTKIKSGSLKKERRGKMRQIYGNVCTFTQLKIDLGLLAPASESLVHYHLDCTFLAIHP